VGEIIGQRHAGLVDAARAARGAGRIVVGYVGLDVPEELILGAGMVPLRLTADLSAPTTAAQRFGDGGHPVLRSLVARLLGGPYDFIDHLVIGSTPRNLTALPILIRQLHDHDAAFARFHVHQLDLLHADSVSAQRYTQGSIRRLAGVLAEWSGQPQREGEQRAAIALCNESRELLQRYQQLRSDGQHLDGVTALQLHGSATGADRAGFNATLHEWLRTDALRTAPGADQLPRVIYSGSATDTTALYASIESQGLCIVDDDQDFGAGAIGPLVAVNEAPLAAIAAAYAQRTPAAAGWHITARAAWLGERITANRPDGVLFYSAAYDHPPAWEYPALRDAAARHGLGTAQLDPQSYNQPASVAAAAHAFALALRAAPPAASA
jgi:benzoyl-CoA reductase/2-hydroxyglutaryl-CoA dehydratase subunit BcrC/BadD/HgdB